jgi:hypothetical protein
MQLYHYRPIETALLEIGNGTLHYASFEELNDPVEGYVCVYWQGDKAAWEGLLRNYICSLCRAIELYLLEADADMLHHKTIVVDVHAFDNVPLGELYERLGNEFLAKDEVQKISTFYGRSYDGRFLKVSKEELEMILSFIHNGAFTLCIQYLKENKIVSPDDADRVLNGWNKINERVEKTARAFEKLDAMSAESKELYDDDKRKVVAQVVKDLFEDGKELQYLQFGRNDSGFLYGSGKRDRGSKETDTGDVDAGAEKTATQRRNWLSVEVDFPKIYVDELREMIYPDSYVVCFSGKNNDSAMWGNYADNHKGVCLVYELDEDLEMLAGKYRIQAKPVCYGGELIERNFFTTLGRLTRPQIKTWLTGTEGVSTLIKEFSDQTEWRDRYWSAYEAKNYRKLKAWEHENEYRIVLDDTFYEYTTPELRNLKYDYKSLRGVIFGINTSEYDKMRIWKKLQEHKTELTDFTFYQAEYDDMEQRLVIRKKGLWKYE